jgi:hypothetical protein
LITKRNLVEITKCAIDSLIKRFEATPYSFYTESDLHAYMYHEIYSSFSAEDLQCKTRDGKSTILLHKEYPTKTRYSAKNLKENVPKGKRGHFDLCIWNPEKTEERLFRVQQSIDFEKEQQTFIAIEFDMTEGNSSLEQAVHHFRWDLLKLRSDKNEVEYGYSLVFVRDWNYSKEFLNKIKSEVVGEDRIVVMYAEKSRDGTIVKTLSKKPF